MTREAQLEEWATSWSRTPTLVLRPLLPADHGLYDELEAELDAEALRRMGAR